MKWLLRVLGNVVGIHFAPDNHVVPVLRWERYHRVRGPGFFWIVPLMERTLPPVKTSLYVGNFVFEEVLSRDNIPFRVQMTLLFTFDPRSAVQNAVATLVRADDKLFLHIVKDYTNQGLRRLAAKFEAEELGRGPAMSIIEQTLTRSLIAEMRALGLVPLRRGGVIIKEIIAPEMFKRAMLNARRLESTLRALAPYPARHLVEQAIQAEFVTGLEYLEGDLTLMPIMSPSEAAYLPHALNPYQSPVRPELSGRNGH